MLTMEENIILCGHYCILIPPSKTNTNTTREEDRGEGIVEKHSEVIPTGASKLRSNRTMALASKRFRTLPPTKIGKWGESNTCKISMKTSYHLTAQTTSHKTKPWHGQEYNVKSIKNILNMTKTNSHFLPPKKKGLKHIKYS